ncbi:chemotaxis protein CheD [Shimia sp. MMG029]|uniref:chemotaxis protein CheD n=1 Tax=Shimia sp. MMG029 TaxID=3021978 RepID=UPI0022FDCCB3|nr:chemotaxis protein CheD [Shimia sp. MMG029]MDA5557704.1 chemotaxis protein CheD [Shimia sp. MMG029]
MSLAEAEAIKGFNVQPLLQGDVQVSNDPQLVMTTILGSCVAACMWDEVAGVGGMNHFLLPGTETGSNGGMSHGVHAMELLVNGLIQAGARRERLRVKLLGGAKMFNSRIDIGTKNAEFATWFVKNEGFELVDCCLGGQRGRNLRFWPVGGRIQRRFMKDTRLIEEESAQRIASKKPAAEASIGDVQLF